MHVASALPELRMARSYPGQSRHTESGWGSSGVHWPGTPGARPPHPGGSGRLGQRPSAGRGAQVPAALRIPRGAGNFHWARRQWAGEGPYRGAQAFPERGGRRRHFRGPRAAPPSPHPAARRPPPPSPAALRFLPRFLPATPRPPGEARPAEKLGGVAAAATRAAGPGKTKGGCVRPKVRKRGAGGGRGGRGPGAGLPPGAYCLPSAHPHALNKKLTHPAAAYQPIHSQTNSAGLLRREGV